MDVGNRHLKVDDLTVGCSGLYAQFEVDSDFALLDYGMVHDLVGFLTEWLEAVEAAGTGI